MFLKITSFPNFGDKYLKICPVTWTTTVTMIGPAVAFAFLSLANLKVEKENLAKY